MRADLLGLRLLCLVIWLGGELESVEIVELELPTSWFPSIGGLLPAARRGCMGTAICRRCDLPLRLQHFLAASVICFRILEAEF